MTPDEQLAEWVKGNPIHNNERDECCPDFSCCEPSLLADQRTREVFIEGDYEVRYQMLMMFLSVGCSQMAGSDNIYVAGDNPDKKYGPLI